MKLLHKFLLSVLTGLLLAAAWPKDGFPLLLFVAFIPLLLVESEHWKNRAENHSSGIMPYAAIAFMMWNVLTTYWIYNSTLVGAIAAFVINTLLMTITFWLFHVTHRKLQSQAAGYIALAAYWLSFEYLHLNWDLNWPWLNLGNGFAAYPRWIQWYEFTGIFGGSLWVIAVNVLLFLFVRDRVIQKICSRAVGAKLISALLLIILPIGVSELMYFRYSEKSNPIDVVVVQPNLDPYSEQYELDPLVVTQRMIALAEQKADNHVDFAVFPESAIQEYVWEDRFDQSGSIALIKAFNSKYARINTIAGISSRKIFEPGEPLSATARKFTDADRYYDAFNTALLVPHIGCFQETHKSKLTPGVERMPYPKVFRFLEKFAIDLGGTVGSLGIDEEQIPYSFGDSLKIAPVICYESVYGEFVNRFVRNGANAIFVITNDGWWGNTPGHRQHMLFSVLRAIETRRSVARSANTGTSCFVNQRGDVFQATEYWKPAVIRQSINANDTITFYVKYGDYIGKFGLLIAALAFVSTIGVTVISKNRKTI